MAWQTLVGAGLAGAGLAGSIFGKKKKAKGPDIGYLTGIVKQGAEKARGLTGQEYETLQPLSQKYGAGIEELGAGYESKIRGLGEEYQKGLAGVGESEKAARDLAVALQQKEEYGAVPLQQQMIREQLAAGGGLRTGAAGKLLAQAPTQAAQRVSQFRTQADIERLSREAARQEEGVRNLYQTQAGAALTKLGLDQTKLQTLLETGRTDIINKYAKLAGIDEAELNAILGIHGLATQTEMANVAAENARQQAILEQLGGLGTSLIGYGLAQQPIVRKGPSAETLRFVRGY